MLLAVLLGGVLRLCWLSYYPIGFTPDEAAFGYNAYSLLLTGKDEWGTKFWHLPLTSLKSFGDYKLPIYAFLSVPSVGAFGLTETATRLPNAIMGTLSIVAIALFTAAITRSSKAGGIAAMMTAISPWAIQLSRGAFEANLVTCLLPLSLACFFINRPLKGVLVLALNVFSYHSARLISIPAVVLAKIFTRFHLSFIPSIILLFIFLPVLLSFLPFGSRVADVAIWNPTDSWSTVADRRFESVIAGVPDPLARVFSNKFSYLANETWSRYISYFSPQFLFTSGPAESTYGMLQGRGVLYFIEIIFLLTFVANTLRHPSSPKILLILLLLLAPLPASLAKGPGLAANRAAPMIPFYLAICASGFVLFLNKIVTSRKTAVTFGFIIIYSLLVAFFTEDYFIHSSRSLARSMLFGYRELFTRSKAIAAEYPAVIISRSLSEPQIYYAFFNKYDPHLYQKSSQSWADFQQHGLKFLDQMSYYSLGKYSFGDIRLENITTPTLLIYKPGEISTQPNNFFIINYPDGTPSVIVSPYTP